MEAKSILLCCVLLQLWSTCKGEANPDTCVECARTPTACRRISGLYTVTVLTEGTYNPVVEIPAPACSINITEFARSSNYIAVKTSRNQGILNSYWGLASPGQYYGAGSRFSYDRNSGACKGSCIFSEGPTTEKIVVQILYYDKNPGIAYEFILPNHVPFTPFDGTYSKQNAPAPLKTASSSSSVSSPKSSAPLTSSSSRSSSSSSSSSSASTPQHHRRHGSQRRYNRHYRNRPRTIRREEKFEGEHYTGSQYSRSEGRPDVTSSLEARIGVKHSGHSGRERSQQQRTRFDYNGARYGSHTLGGKGLSYTAANGSGRERLSNRRIINRYRSRTSPRTTNPVRKAPAPQYVSGTRSSRPYSRQSQYQSLSSKTSYLTEENSVKPNSNTLSTITRPLPAGQGRNVGGSSYKWKISGLTECSKTCGRGVQRTNVVCVSKSSRTQVVVTPENCANSLKPRTQTVECNSQPCEPAWEAEDWSECSVTCGSGTQTRTVECRQRFSPSLVLRVSADQCGLAEKPAVAQQCEKGLCSEWQAGTWGECSKECGGGQRTRSVLCVDRFESQIPSNYCTEAKPRESEPCNTNKCNSQWWMSDWSKECSETCGQGHRRRSALCMNDAGDVVSENYCFREELPQLKEACKSDVDCRGTWFAGAWGRCSSSCGEGTRRRQVVCLQRGATEMEIVRDENCEASLRPDSQEPCSNADCSAVWYTSNWSECSVTCGDGIRTRESRCVEDGRSSLSCVGSLKPHTREVCSLSACIDYQRTDRYTERAERYRPRKSRYRSSLETSRQGNTESYAQLTLGGGVDGGEERRTLIESVSGEREEEKEVDVEDDFEDVEEENKSGHSSDIASSSSSSQEAQEDCKDNYFDCLVVAQSRLCPYEYYKHLCCQTCSKLKHSKGPIGV